MPRGVYVRTEQYRAKLSAAGKGRQMGNQNGRTHGQSNTGDRSGTPTYGSWRAMRERCTNPKNKYFKNYGGRGITVCDRWHIFEHFLADMGERPPGLTLDRKDNDGNYEPGNCRWATPSEQNKNESPRKI